MHEQRQETGFQSALNDKFFFSKSTFFHKTGRLKTFQPFETYTGRELYICLIFWTFFFSHLATFGITLFNCFILRENISLLYKYEGASNTRLKWKTVKLAIRFLFVFHFCLSLVSSPRISSAGYPNHKNIRNDSLGSESGRCVTLHLPCPHPPYGNE